MPLATRSARAIWEGNLTEGKGTFTTGSGAFGEQPVTWAARTQEPGGRTSPEELIAAAQAACYAMALSNTLNTRGTPPQRLAVNCTCTLDRVEGGVKITQVTIEVVGVVPGVDQAGFEQVAQEAERGCPVANALRNNVNISVNARLQQAETGAR
jgi:osmotically inducible protein OsmC